MKFVKSNWAKKLIILLVIILLINVTIPQEVKAFDPLGVVLEQFIWAYMSPSLIFEVTLGLTLNGINIAFDSIAGLVNLITGELEDGASTFGSILRRIFIGPDTIFAGDMKIFDANIFKFLYDATASGAGDILGDTFSGQAPISIGSMADLASELSSSAGTYGHIGSSILTRVSFIVARFYIILRNICAMVMLAGLIFTGIRILISSNIPTQKTQYLMLLQDWLMGMCLLIFSHIIMVLIFEISDALVAFLAPSILNYGSFKFEILVKLFASGDSVMIITSWMMYIYIQWLTIVFAVAYLKRYIWVCILVVFAPVFAVMYAFGQKTKQIYSKWLSEFILTVFVQPFHIVIYSVLIGIPMGMSGTLSPSSGIFETIYALFAMTMIRPAEKYMRSLFGMDKGIANMASYDSGMKTVVAAAKAVVAVAATVVTGGAAAGALGAAGALAGAGKAGAALGKVGSALGKAGESTKMLDQGMKAADTANDLRKSPIRKYG